MVPGSNPALATCWICSLSSRVEILANACKKATGCLLPVGVLILLYIIMYVVFGFFVFKYLSGLPAVN